MSYKFCAFADEASNEFSGQIEALKSKNIAYLEIRNLDGKNIANLSVNEAKEICQRLADNGLKIWSVGSRLGKIGIKEDFAPHLDEFEHTLELAKALECDRIRMFSFYMPNDEDPGIYRDEVMERLGRFVDRSKGSGITLCHENEKEIYGDVPQRCLEIVENFPEIKAVFDPANFVQCGVDTLAAWDMLEGYVSYMHIKDSLADGRIVPAGHGDGNIKALLKKYQAIGGEVLTLEPHLFVFDGLRTLERREIEKKDFPFEYADSKLAFTAAYDALKALI